jgi:hypothetical protein
VKALISASIQKNTTNMLVRAMDEIESYAIYVRCSLKFIPQLVKRGATWFFWINIMGGSALQWRYTAKMVNNETGMRVEFCICKVTFNKLSQPARRHTQSFGTLFLVFFFFLPLFSEVVLGF